MVPRFLNIIAAWAIPKRRRSFCAPISTWRKHAWPLRVGNSAAFGRIGLPARVFAWCSHRRDIQPDQSQGFLSLVSKMQQEFREPWFFMRGQGGKEANTTQVVAGS